MKKSILLVDDDPHVSRMLRELFARRGWVVSVAMDGLSGLALYESVRPDLVLLDIDMPGISGLDVLRVIIDRHDATVVMLTGHAQVDVAVTAMRAGAENFITKPPDLDHLLTVVDRAYEKAELKKVARRLARQIPGDAPLSSLVRSPIMQDIARQASLLAAGSAPILITGETGTGKGWLAHVIHSASPRGNSAFLSINCAGLTATGLDGELFGHEEVTHTAGKPDQHDGLFEVADGGTLFLDEVGDLAPELQPKLLTVIETGRFRRSGFAVERVVDVRLIAATHRDLLSSVKAGRFRDDLYYRLAVLPIRMPTLRERGAEELAALADELLSDLTLKMGRRSLSIPVESLKILTEYHWPGNIRELRNVLERAVLLAGDGSTLLPRHLPTDIRPRASDKRSAPMGTDLSLKSVERRHIERVLHEVKGNRARAARELGIPRSTLYKKLTEYGIS